MFHEVVVAPYAGWLWLRGGFGRSLDIARHREVQGAWVGSLLRWAGRLLAVSVSWPEAGSVPDGKIVVLSRHASMIDAVIPAYHFASRLHRPIHYVLKRELRWLPSIDIYGHRLGNHFIDRQGNTESEVAAIIELIESAEPNAGIVIFPEGTYATPDSRARVLASLEKRGDHELLEFARQLHYLLPPKPAGALALLQRTRDVVIFGHVGLEGVAELKGLVHNLPAKHPILTETWSYHIADLPDLDEARITWLRGRWLALDQWVGEQHTTRGNEHVRP
jgi:1-acyl-sn-glycerol-3-phosphate acyltransferase